MNYHHTQGNQKMRGKSLLIGTMLIASLTAGCGTTSSDNLIDNPKDTKQLGKIEQLSDKTSIKGGLDEAIYDGIETYLSSFHDDGKAKVDALTIKGHLDGDPIAISKTASPVVKKIVLHDIKITYSVGSITNSGLVLTIYPALSERPSKSNEEEKKELSSINFDFTTQEEGPRIKKDFFQFISSHNDKLTPKIQFDLREGGTFARNPVAAGDVIVEKVDNGIQISYVVGGATTFSQLIEGNFYGIRPQASSMGVKAIVDIY